MDPRACRKCGSTTNGFHKNPMYKDGLHPYCKVCRSALSKARIFSETQEKRQERLRKASEYRNRPDRVERQKELVSEWRAKNPARFAELRRKADRKRQPAKSKYMVAWRKKNKEVVASHSRNRRAAIRRAEGSHTADDVVWLIQIQRGLCAVCRKTVIDKYHVDHIVPLSSGGANSKENLQVLCPTCNNQKHALDPIEFMQRKGFLL